MEKEIKNNKEKEEENMNACAIKPTTPFVTSKSLKRTPATQENIDRIRFMDSHNFSFDVDENKHVNIQVSRKYENPEI